MGPLTVRQFLIVLITAGILYLVYRVSDFSFFIVVAIVVGGSAAVLAFYRVNSQPFHYFLLHVFQTLKVPSLRVWKKELPLPEREIKEKNAKTEEKQVVTQHPDFDRQRLSEIALVVDTGGAYRSDDKEETELF